MQVDTENTTEQTTLFKMHILLGRKTNLIQKKKIKRNCWTEAGDRVTFTFFIVSFLTRLKHQQLRVMILLMDGASQHRHSWKYHCGTNKICAFPQL